MARNLHHNIFGYYRGPSPRTVGDAAYHRQVEDNTTKALVNVLELGGSGLAASFARRFAHIDDVDSPWGFHLQRGPDDVAAGPRVLLGISLLGEMEPGGKGSGDGSRIDAALEPPNGGLVAIEIKTASERLDAAQLERHAERWTIQTAPVLVEWAEVWQWAREECNAADGDAARFLLDQFAEYLELIGLAAWGGFKDADFDYFAHPAEDLRLLVRNRIGGVWPLVLEKLSAEERQALGATEVGRLPVGADHGWAQTNRGENRVNLSVELYAEELQLNAVGWTKAPAARLERALLDELLPMIPVELVVFERRPAATKSGAPMWRGVNLYDEVSRFSVAELRTGAFALWRESHAPSSGTTFAYHLRRSWSRAQAVGLGERLVNDVVEDVRRLLPWLLAVRRSRQARTPGP